MLSNLYLISLQWACLVLLKDVATNGKEDSPDALRRRNLSAASNPDISPSTSMARLTVYEDDQCKGKVGVGGSRVRNDSLSTITGVRFDAHLNN